MHVISKGWNTAKISLNNKGGLILPDSKTYKKLQELRQWYWHSYTLTLSGNKVELCISGEWIHKLCGGNCGIHVEKVNLCPIPHICRISFLLLIGLKFYVIDYLDNLGTGKMFMNMFMRRTCLWLRRKLDLNKT